MLDRARRAVRDAGRRGRRQMAADYTSERQQFGRPCRRSRASRSRPRTRTSTPRRCGSPCGRRRGGSPPDSTPRTRSWWRSGGPPRRPACGAHHAAPPRRDGRRRRLSRAPLLPVGQIEDTLAARARSSPGSAERRGGTGMKTKIAPLRRREGRLTSPDPRHPADAHAHRGDRDRASRLPGRAPRPGLAQERGSPDIFMNILLDQRFRRPVHHRLGGARRDPQEREDPARRPTTPATP